MVFNIFNFDIYVFRIFGFHCFSLTVPSPDFTRDQAKILAIFFFFWTNTLPIKETPILRQKVSKYEIIFTTIYFYRICELFFRIFVL